MFAEFKQIKQGYNVFQWLVFVIWHNFVAAISCVYLTEVSLLRKLWFSKVSGFPLPMTSGLMENS